MTTFIGIDYSLTSPAITVLNDDSYKNSLHFFFTDKPEKYPKSSEMLITPLQYPTFWKIPFERYSAIANTIVDIVKVFPNPFVAIEGYAMMGNGKVFNIAEGCGVMKYLLYINNIEFTDNCPPSSVKKFATNKGNADKQLVYDAFVNLTGHDIHKTYQPNKQLKSSFASDIADSFFIAEYGKNLYKTTLHKL
jgi:Holliday junction resolvasome RuvABC endonuclease subunit